jgi:hypothetical protein
MIPYINGRSRNPGQKLDLDVAARNVPWTFAELRGVAPLARSHHNS